MARLADHYGGFFFFLAGICVSECLEEQATDYRRSVAGEHRNGGAAAMWRLLFFSFFLSDGKLLLAAMESLQYSACSGGNVFLGSLERSC